MRISAWTDTSRLSQYLYPASRPAYTRGDSADLVRRARGRSCPTLLGRALDGGARGEVLRQRLVVAEVAEELRGRGVVPFHGRPDARAQAQVRDRHRGGHRVLQRERDGDQLRQAGALVDRDRGRGAVGRGDDRE